MTEKQSNKKLLIVSGPTATGKTKLALHLAKLFNGELISADSRQVYKEMDIGTGKDWGTKNKEQRTKSSIHIWGYDLVNPDEEWSAAHFVKFATKVINDIHQRNKLPIIVGGTGLYIKNLLSTPETLFVPPNKKLRERLQLMTISQLQDELKKISPERLGRMNESDRENPRRLVRAIEVTTWSSREPVERGRGDLIREIATSKTPRNDTLHIALIAPLIILNKRIEKRVKQRLNQGVEKEVKKIVEKYGWDSALSHTIAYQEWRPYFENKTPLEKVIQTWTTHEKQYARRQITWLKKYQPKYWFDITDTGFPNNIVSLVGQWYDQTNAD